MKKNRLFQRKAKGSGLYLLICMILILFMLLLFFNIYRRSINTLADNLKASVDAANLAATTVDVNYLQNTNNIDNVEDDELHIVGCANSGPILTEEEKDVVTKRFISYQMALMNNVGLNNDYFFSGGTCGWAANILTNNGLTITEFRIYEIVDDKVIIYKVKGDITSSTNNPEIIKNVADLGSCWIYFTNMDYTNRLVTEPTVYSEISLTIKKLPILRNAPKKVYKTSVTSIKEN